MFVGVFIFSVVVLIMVKNVFFVDVGVFLLFVFIGIVFVVVIFMFICWVDSVVRLGCVGLIVKKVEDVVSKVIYYCINNLRLVGIIFFNINVLVE